MTAPAATFGPSVLERLPRGAWAIAWGGVGLGLLAFFVALPPITVRSPVWPILIGMLKAIIDTVTTSTSWRLVELEGESDPPAAPGAPA